MTVGTQPPRAAVLVAALLCTAGCQTSGGEADDGAATEAIESANIGDEYGYRSRLEFTGAVGADDPTAARRRLARSNLGLAAAIRRGIPDLREELEESRGSRRVGAERKKAMAKRVVESAEPYREVDLAPIREAYRKVAERDPPLVLTGTYHSLIGPARQRANTLAFAYGDRLYPVFAHLSQPIAGYLVGPRRERVAVVVGNEGSGPVVYWVELDDFRVRRTAFDTHELVDAWMRVGWAGHRGALAFWGEKEGRPVVGRCSLHNEPACEWRARTDFHEFLSSDVRTGETLTLAGATWLFSTRLPDGLTDRFDFTNAHPAGRVLAPSVRLSPDETHIAFVTAAGPHAGQRERRRLWVEHLATGERRVVAEGKHWLNARWLGPDRLAFDGPPSELEADFDDIPNCSPREVRRRAWNESVEDPLAHRRCRFRTQWANESRPILVHDLETGDTTEWLPTAVARLRTPDDVRQGELEFRDWPDFLFHR